MSIYEHMHVILAWLIAYKEYIIMAVVAIVFGWRTWKNGQINDILQKVLAVIERWSNEQLEWVTEEQVREVAGYFYDVTKEKLPIVAQPIVAWLLPRNLVQDTVWELWTTYIILPDTVIAFLYQ